MKKRLLMTCLLATSLSGALLAPGALADLPPSIGEPSPSKSSGKTERQAVPVPLSAQIFILPFLVGGHKYTLSVTDGDGKPLSNAAVYLNEELFLSDSMGTVTFAAPESESFELFLQGEGKKKIAKRKFHRVAEKVAAETDRLAESAAALLNLNSSTGSAPTISYAPAVVCPGDAFVIVGQNFSDKLAENYVDIDGLNAPVLCASQDGILALAPLRLRLGPLRELSVSVNNLASNTAEVDVATPFFNHVKTESDEVSPENGKLGMNGTSVPCLVWVENPETENVTLWSPKQEPLAKTNLVLTPGGEQNFLDIDLRMLSRKAKEPQIKLSMEQPLTSGLAAKTVPPQLLMAACRAEIIRIERRKIAAEARLDALRQMESKESATAKNIESDKREAEFKALSLRMSRLRKMLVSRKCIFESLGNTDAQFRQVLDDAAGGAALSLDQSTKQIVIVSDGGVGYSGVTPIATSVTPSAKKGRPHRLLEPVIRLLPPMTAAETAAMPSSSSSSNSSSGSSSASTGSTNPQESSDRPTLRQNFIEPEPGFSAASRASGTQQSDSSSKPADKPTITKPAEKPMTTKPALKPKTANAIIDTSSKSKSKLKKGKPEEPAKSKSKSRVSRRSQPQPAPQKSRRRRHR